MPDCGGGDPCSKSSCDGGVVGHGVRAIVVEGHVGWLLTELKVWILKVDWSQVTGAAMQFRFNELLEWRTWERRVGVLRNLPRDPTEKIA